LLDSLNQEGPFYVDPNLTAGTTLEVAVYANKSVRPRTDKGDGVPAILDSEDTIEKAEVSAKVESSPPVRAPAAPAPSSASKVVLLENGDFIDLENQELKAQDIGDGAVLYSFAGDSSSTRIGSARPVFLVMMPGNIELARVQVGKGNRQLLYSAAKKHSASPLAVNVSQVSDTLRRITVSEPLAHGEYVLLVIDSNKDDSSRAYLFEAR
jgi:hypothetical protein